MEQIRRALLAVLGTILVILAFMIQAEFPIKVLMFGLILSTYSIAEIASALIKNERKELKYWVPVLVSAVTIAISGAILLTQRFQR